MMIVLLLICCFILESQQAAIRQNEVQTNVGSFFDENFYRFFTELSHGKIFNVSTASHELLEILGYYWPDYDPLEFPAFNCPIKRPEPFVAATSVHKLTAFDVNVIAAMGDSLTAAFGALSYTLVDLFVEYRGASWSIGGDDTLEKRITLPNILKKYNPQITGYSTGETPALIALPWENLNVAVSGSTAFELMEQAQRLVHKLKTNKKYDFDNDWKILTIFIGGNDLCSCCRKYKHYNILYTPEHYIRELTKVLDYLSANVPRMFVNMVDAPDVTVLNKIQTVKCDFTHYIECKCGSVLGEEARNYTRRALRKYHTLLHDLIKNSGRYDKKDDFAVVLQPFFDTTTIPTNKDGSPDRSYWAPDCFHFSGKAHAASGMALWNNMNQPVNKKKTRWSVGDDYICPTEKNPYFYTNLNSKDYQD